jgi:hypothetical protein
VCHVGAGAPSHGSSPSLPVVGHNANWDHNLASHNLAYIMLHGHTCTLLPWIPYGEGAAHVLLLPWMLKLGGAAQGLMHFYATFIPTLIPSCSLNHFRLYYNKLAPARCAPLNFFSRTPLRERGHGGLVLPTHISHLGTLEPGLFFLPQGCIRLVCVLVWPFVGVSPRTPLNG